MILSDQRIVEEIHAKNIIIEPFRREALGSCSYDVHLGKILAVYATEILDAKIENPLKYFEIPDEGLVIQPRELYLGVTEEYTETLSHVPFLEGKSSIGRLGIDIYATAGKGEIGFCNYWTLEISCTKPVRIYAGMPIGQLVYFELSGKVQTSYSQNVNAKYVLKTPKPVGSMMWKNFIR